MNCQRFDIFDLDKRIMTRFWFLGLKRDSIRVDCVPREIPGAKRSTGSEGLSDFNRVTSISEKMDGWVCKSL